MSSGGYVLNHMIVNEGFYKLALYITLLCLFSRLNCTVIVFILGS